MGALRDKMIEEMKLRNFAGEDAEVLSGRDGRVGQALPSVPGSTDGGIDPGVSVVFAGPGAVEQFAEREYFGFAVFLSAGFRMESRTVLLTTKKTELALAESTPVSLKHVPAEGS